MVSQKDSQRFWKGKFFSDEKRSHIALLISIFILLILTIIPLEKSIKKNDGHLIYTLDDTYIHMAIAKNISLHGTFGVTRYEFTPSSSSPLWTLLLSSCFYIFGVQEIIPFLLNIIFSILLLIWISKYLRRGGFSEIHSFLIMSGFIIFLPLPYLIMTGLEHILQILLTLIIIQRSSEIINQGKSEKGITLTLIFAFFLTATRFEGLFIIASISLLLIIKKRVLTAGKLLFSGALPVIIYGIISLINGWYLLPNPVLLKGNRPGSFSPGSIMELLETGAEQLIQNIHLFALLLAAVMLLLIFSRQKSGKSDSAGLVSYIFISTLLLHMMFARSGFFLKFNFQLRYDSYLVAMGLFTIFCTPSMRKFILPKKDAIEKLLTSAFIFILVLPLTIRGIKTVAIIPDAASNTYSNQYMQGIFINSYYPKSKVVLNDIGGVNFLSDIHCLDILGLSSRETSYLILNGEFKKKKISEVVTKFGASIAIVNRELLERIAGIPDYWILAGQWKLKKSVISKLDTISFYAIGKQNLPKLSLALNRFSNFLPDTLYFRLLR